MLLVFFYYCLAIPFCFMHLIAYTLSTIDNKHFKYSTGKICMWLLLTPVAIFQHINNKKILDNILLEDNLTINYLATKLINNHDENLLLCNKYVKYSHSLKSLIAFSSTHSSRPISYDEFKLLYMRNKAKFNIKSDLFECLNLEKTELELQQKLTKLTEDELFKILDNIRN